jgi:hypothetical protein
MTEHENQIVFVLFLLAIMIGTVIYAAVDLIAGVVGTWHQ